MKTKPYDDLAHAIVMQAVTDYRRLLRGEPIIEAKGRKVSLEEIEQFIKSDWFFTLTNVDGNKILKKLKEEYANEVLTNRSMGIQPRTKRDAKRIRKLGKE